MSERPPPDPQRGDRLRALLAVRGPSLELFSAASPEAVAEARALGPEAAGAVAAELLRAYVKGTPAGSAERAADLARELQLHRAVPSLVDCLERLGEHDSVSHAALRALDRLRAPATDLLLAAFRRSATRGERDWMGTALARVGLRDGRARVVLTTLLEDDPIKASGLLAEHGDRDAVADLSAVLDRLAVPPQGPGELAKHEEIVAVAQAILSLRGELTPAQRTKFAAAYARSDELWADGGAEVEAFVERGGRSDP